VTDSGTADLDIERCVTEPIRIPGSIQPHGALFVVDPESLEILQAAVGDDDAVASGAAIQGARLPDLLPPEAEAMLTGIPARLGSEMVQLGTVRGREAEHHLLAHRTQDGIIVELERAAGAEPGLVAGTFPNVRGFLEGLSRCSTISELAALAAREVRAITGLDRALVYRFDENWNGTVVAEDRNDALPSYLDLRFPASDIPAQARDLYRINRLRLIASADYRPEPIEPALNPRTGKPTDLSFSVLRSVSPVHLEYMRNMGTGASMSISLMRGDQLWGLISCHNKEPAAVGYPVREACDFIAQILSMQITALEGGAYAARRAELQSVAARLLANMAASASRPAGRFVEGLARAESDLLALTGAQGAAIVTGEDMVLLGRTPPESGVREIVSWLADGVRDDLFATDSLAADMAWGERFKEQASGLLAISVSQMHASYLLWFRPEVIETVTWGGDPRKRAESDGAGPDGRLHPRTSFEAWQETVRLHAVPWDQAELEVANSLRTAIVDIVLRQAEELAALSDRLAASNRELEAFSYSVSHDLRAPFRHIVGYAQLLKKFEGEKLSERGNRFVDTIIESAISAGTLVDDLLSFSQMGRATLVPVQLDLAVLVAEVRRLFEHVEDGRTIEWRVGALPHAFGDPMMLKLAVQNLLENAIKFTRGREPSVIEIGGRETEDEVLFWIKDNGTGFDMAYVGKLFGVFQRLHRVEEFEGTGIGLANVKRIIERHGGIIAAEGKLNEGATFTVTLPKRRG